jgi:hypothetical protein
MQGSAGRGGPGKQCHPSIGDVQASGRGYTGAVFKGLIKFKNRDKLISKLNDIILRLHPLNIKHPQNDAITSPSRYLLVTPSFLSLSVLCRVHIFFGGLVCIIIQWWEGTPLHAPPLPCLLYNKSSSAAANTDTWVSPTGSRREWISNHLCWYHRSSMWVQL